MVLKIRKQRLRIWDSQDLLFITRTIQFNSIGIGRDKLFSILKANHMLIKLKRSYRKTNDSHHRFHKNLIEEVTPSRPE